MCKYADIPCRAEGMTACLHFFYIVSYSISLLLAGGSYFTLLFSWLLAFDGFDLPILFPVGFFLLLVRRGRVCVFLFPLIIFV